MKKPNIEQFTVSYDKSNGESVGVTEILNFKDLSYTFFLNGKCEISKFLTKKEALNKFGHFSETIKNKILKGHEKII